MGDVNRDEDIARLLQQRDSLLSHFQQISPMHRSSQSAFDINALRQRGQLHHLHSNRGHRRCQTSVNKVDLTYLPIRCIEVSDIGKGAGKSCSICQEKFKIGDKVKTLPCFHFFHVQEIDRWLKTSRVCPVCRHSIDEINFK